MPQRVEDPYGTKDGMSPIIQTKFATAEKCAVLFCKSCLLSRSKKRSTGEATKKAMLEKHGILAWDKYEVGI